MGWGPRATRSIPPHQDPWEKWGPPELSQPPATRPSARSPQQAEAGSTETGSTTNSCVLIWAP